MGLALHKDGHVGYTVGGGYAVEWQGFNSGCVKTKIAGRGWTSWFKLPFIDYNDGTSHEENPTLDVPLGSRLLKKGMTGTDVSTDETLIFGHTPTYRYSHGLPVSIWHGQNRIDIDCGAGHGYGGRLACLRLDDMAEFYVDAQ